MTNSFVVSADTAEQFRAEAVRFFDDELERHDRQVRSLPPRTQRDEAVKRAQRQSIVNNRDFFRDLTISPKATGIHVRIREDAELAIIYAEDGAFHTAGDRLAELAANVKAHAADCDRALNAPG